MLGYHYPLLLVNFRLSHRAGIINPHQPEPRRPGKFKFENQRLQRWRSADEIWVHGYFGRDWSDEHIKVKSIDYDSRTISLAEPTRYGHYPGKRFYFLNLLEEIDKPGEWYLDRSRGVLYFWPPTLAEGGEVYVSVLEEPLIKMQNASHVIFQDITIEISRGDGIQINGGTENIISKCTIRNLGNRGITISGGKNHGITKCDIYDTGDGAIQISGGDRLTLTPAGHYAENNHIYRYSRWDRTYRPAVSLGGVGNRAVHNKIHDGEHLAILLNGNDHLVEYNEIHDVVKETTDTGALYIRFNPTYRGNVIRYNYFHHIANSIPQSGQFGVYIDDGASGVLIYGNVFYLVGGGELAAAIKINGGKENCIENNLFVNCKTCVTVNAWKPEDWMKFVNSDLFTKALVEVAASGPRYTTSYPALKNLIQNNGVNVIRTNIAYSCSQLLSQRWGTTQELTGNYFDKDSSIAKTLKKKFELINASSLIKIDGFQPIPFEMIGLSRAQRRTPTSARGGGK